MSYGQLDELIIVSLDFFFTFRLQNVFVSLSGDVLRLAVCDDQLPHLVRGRQLYRRLVRQRVAQICDAAPLDQDGQDARLASLGGVMQWSTPIHIEGVDFAAHRDYFLNHLDLVLFEEHCVVQWRAAPVVLHPHDSLLILSVGQYRQQFWLARTRCVVHGGPSAIVSGLWVGAFFHEQFDEKCVADLASVV